VKGVKIKNHHMEKRTGLLEMAADDELAELLNTRFFLGRMSDM
jgi:hypothetical protein